MFVFASSTEVIQHGSDALSIGLLYAVLTVGFSLVFGVLGLVNWAYGEMLTTGAYVLVIFSAIAMPVLLPLMVLVVVILSLLLERLAFRPVRGANLSAQLVVALGASIILQSLFLLFLGANPRSASISVDLLKPVHIGDVAIAKLNILTFGVCLTLLIGLTVLLTRTVMGVQLRAVAQDFDMARLLGVRADRVVALAFVLCGIVAGVTAFLFAARAGVVTPIFGVTPLLIGFTCAVLGGLGSLNGAVLGGLLVGISTVLLDVFLPQSLRPYRDSFLFAGVFLILSFRSEGLIVPKTRVKRV